MMILDIFRKGKRGKARRNRSGRYVLPRVVGLIGFVCHFFFTRGASPILNSILLFLVELALTCFWISFTSVVSARPRLRRLVQWSIHVEMQAHGCPLCLRRLANQNNYVFFCTRSRSFSLSLSISQSLYLSSSLTVISLFAVFFLLHVEFVSRDIYWSVDTSCLRTIILFSICASVFTFQNNCNYKTKKRFVMCDFFWRTILKNNNEPILISR